MGFFFFCFFEGTAESERPPPPARLSDAQSHSKVTTATTWTTNVGHQLEPSTAFHTRTTQGKLHWCSEQDRMTSTNLSKETQRLHFHTVLLEHVHGVCHYCPITTWKGRGGGATAPKDSYTWSSPSPSGAITAVRACTHSSDTVGTVHPTTHRRTDTQMDMVYLSASEGLTGWPVPLKTSNAASRCSFICVSTVAAEAGGTALQ